MYKNIITMDNGLIFIKDHNIYDIFYKNINVGYVILSKINDCIKAIKKDGFYNGRDYSRRINNIDNGLIP